MKVRIVRKPEGTLNGSALHLYRTGEAYDLPVTVGEYLVLEGFAIVEMRSGDNPEVPLKIERRRSGR